MIAPLLYLAVLLLSVSADPVSCLNIVETAQASPSLSTLVQAVGAANLVDTLTGPGPFTVFAPTNDAFAALPTGVLEALLLPCNRGKLVEVLTYHVVEGEALSTSLTNGQSITTVNGAAVTVGIDTYSTVTINGATVILADVDTCNGVVHVINQVLVPTGLNLAPASNIVQLAQGNGDLSTLVTAVVAADLVGTLSGPGPFTVFAPTNDAFAALPADLLAALLLPENKDKLVEVLTYHVVDASAFSTDLTDQQAITTVNGADVVVSIYGASIMINAATVIIADLRASNGVVHAIDQVLVPAGFTLERPSIVDIASGDARFSTLVTAVVAADLVGTLSGPGPFTVFAPTNDAFAALPADLLAALLLPENKDKLVEVLTYHVVAASAFSTDLTDQQLITTVNGADVVVSISEYSIMINTATVRIADLRASNGVVHAIDQVLVPVGFTLDDPCVPGTDLVELAQSVDQLSTLVSVVVAADLAEALSGPGPFTVFAPSNNAFNKLASNQIDYLLEPANKEVLQKVLLYHVSSGVTLSTDLVNHAELPTLEGSTLTVRKYYSRWKRQYRYYIEGGRVIAADNEACNGVAHIINSVLIPPGVHLPAPHYSWFNILYIIFGGAVGALGVVGLVRRRAKNAANVAPISVPDLENADFDESLENCEMETVQFHDGAPSDQ